MWNRYRALVLTCGTIGAMTNVACAVNIGGEESVVREEKRFSVTENPEIVLNTFDGSIRVQAWDRNDVLIEIERRARTREDAERIEVSTSQEGNRIRVDVPKRGPSAHSDAVFFSFGWGESVSFVVTAPRRATIRARTGDGSVALRDLTGTFELRTGDGAISAENLTGDLSANTGDGAVRVVDGVGRVMVQTGDGSVEIGGKFEELRAHTGDGSVQIEVAPGSTMTSDWNIGTGDGGIAMAIPSEFDADLDASSGDGGVTASGPGLTVRRTDDEQRSLRGRIGSGGHVLRVHSGDGAIAITALPGPRGPADRSSAARRPAERAPVERIPAERVPAERVPAERVPSTP